MIQRDFIKRMIEQMALVVAKLLDRDPKEKLEIIDEAYQEWLKLDSKAIADISPEAMMKWLLEEKKYNVHQLELLAEIIHQEGEAFYELEFPEKSKDRLQKALYLFDYVDKNQGLYSIDRIAKMDNIKTRLESL